MESRTQWSKDLKREKDVQFNTAANLRVVDIKEIKFSKVMIRNKKYIECSITWNFSGHLGV